MKIRLVLALALAWTAACGSGSNLHDGRGIVRDVVEEYDQLVIEHEDIPGFMKAMTMNFDVADPAVLARVHKGDVIEFRVEYTGRAYVVRDVRVVGADESAGLTAERLVADRDPAPDFTLTDQSGHTVSLADLRGKTLVVDFIFTHCPGPCPILTGIGVDLQRRLDAELRQRVWFVSISLDPERDTPEVLRAYGEKRGVDFSDWSFLTGDPETVADVVRRWGIGSTREPDGRIDHLVATFLVDAEGRIAERYLGTNHRPEDLERDLRRIAS